MMDDDGMDEDGMGDEAMDEILEEKKMRYRPTDGRTDKSSYRVAYSRLKTKTKIRDEK